MGLSTSPSIPWAGYREDHGTVHWPSRDPDYPQSASSLSATWNCSLTGIRCAFLALQGRYRLLLVSISTRL